MTPDHYEPPPIPWWVPSWLNVANAPEILCAILFVAVLGFGCLLGWVFLR